MQTVQTVKEQKPHGAGRWGSLSSPLPSSPLPSSPFPSPPYPLSPLTISPEHCSSGWPHPHGPLSWLELQAWNYTPPCLGSTFF
jgi:hypothetical protein